MIRPENSIQDAVQVVKFTDKYPAIIEHSERARHIANLYFEKYRTTTPPTEIHFDINGVDVAYNGETLKVIRYPKGYSEMSTFLDEKVERYQRIFADIQAAQSTSAYEQTTDTTSGVKVEQDKNTLLLQAIKQNADKVAMYIHSYVGIVPRLAKYFNGLHNFDRITEVVKPAIDNLTTPDQKKAAMQIAQAIGIGETDLPYAVVAIENGLGASTYRIREIENILKSDTPREFSLLPLHEVAQNELIRVVTDALIANKKLVTLFGDRSSGLIYYYLKQIINQDQNLLGPSSPKEYTDAIVAALGVDEADEKEVSDTIRKAMYGLPKVGGVHGDPEQSAGDVLFRQAEKLQTFTPGNTIRERVRAFFSRR